MHSNLGTYETRVKELVRKLRKKGRCEPEPIFTQRFYANPRMWERSCDAESW